MDGNTQVGCSIGMLKNFEDAGATITDREDNGTTTKVIDRVCMYRRHTNSKFEDVASEIFPKASFVIIHKLGESEDKLEQSINSIKEMKFISLSKPKIVICHEENFSKMIAFSKNEDFSFANVHIVCMIEKLYTDHMYDEAFKRCSNGYVFFLNSGQEVSEDKLVKLNIAINILMLRVLSVTGDVECHMATMYKYLKGNREKTINQKVEDMNKLFPSKTSYTWEEIDDKVASYLKR